MVCRDYLDFEEKRESCIVEQILPAILVMLITTSVLLYFLFDTMMNSDFCLMIKFLTNNVKIKRDWAVFVLSIMWLESVLSLSFILVFPFFILLKKVYINSFSDRDDKFFAPFVVGLICSISTIHFIIPEGQLLLALVTITIMAFLILILALISLSMLHIVGKIGAIFSGMHPTILVFLILRAEASPEPISYFLLVVYVLLIFSLIYLDISISNFWRLFGEIYIKPRGYITKSEIEQLFSIKLDRPRAIYLSTLFEKIGLKVSVKLRGNDVEIFEVRK